MSSMFLRAPGRTLTISVTAWWSKLAMVPLSILLAIHQMSDTYALAGIAVGCYGLGHALLAPIKGRLVDRFGVTVITYLASICALSLSGLAVSVITKPGAVLALVFCAIAGLSSPPIIATARAKWASLVEGASLRRATASIVVSGDISHAIGPVLVVAIALSISPAAALMLCAALTIIAARAIVQGSKASSQFGDADESERASTVSLLKNSTFRTLMVIDLTLGLTIGGIDVSMPAFASEYGRAAHAGFLLGAFAVGSAIASYLFARRERSVSINHYPIFICLVAVAYMFPPFAHSIWQMLLILSLAGAATAPATILLFESIDYLAPRHQAVEAFTWIATAFTVGISLGSVLAGALIDSYSLTASLAVSLVAASAGAGVAVGNRRAFRKIKSV